MEKAIWGWVSVVQGVCKGRYVPKWEAYIMEQDFDFLYFNMRSDFGTILLGVLGY